MHFQQKCFHSFQVTEQNELFWDTTTPSPQGHNKTRIIPRIVNCTWINICYETMINIVRGQPSALAPDDINFYLFLSPNKFKTFQTLSRLSKFHTFPQSWKILVNFPISLRDNTAVPLGGGGGRSSATSLLTSTPAEVTSCSVYTAPGPGGGRGATTVAVRVSPPVSAAILAIAATSPLHSPRTPANKMSKQMYGQWCWGCYCRFLKRKRHLMQKKVLSFSKLSKY